MSPKSRNEQPPADSMAKDHQAEDAVEPESQTNTSRHLKSKSKKAKHVLPINKKFADHYETSKRKQLLSTIPAALLEDDDASDSSDDEEEDEFAEQLTKRIDRRVYKTLEAIRKKDPEIYDSKKKFFESDAEHSGDETEEENDSEDEPVAGWDVIEKAARDGTPKMTLKDYVRKTLLTDGKLSDSEDDQPQVDDPDYYKSNKAHLQHEEKMTRRKPAAQTEAGQSEKKALLDADADSGDESDASSTDEFFHKKTKTSAEEEAEEKDFEAFMKKQQLKKAKSTGEDLLLHSYLGNEKPDEKERFLRDFVLNNGWLDKNATDAPEAGDYAIEVDVPEASLRAGDAEDHDGNDEFNEKVDEFEANYNFRFEEPGGSQVISFGRTIPGSMRRQDDRRKQVREARKSRKTQEKLVKTEEIKQLKNLKKKEIQARLLAIQDAAGDGIDTSGIDLDADFDPDEFNKQMESKFGEDYYSQMDGEMKELTKEGVAVASERRLPTRSAREESEEIRKDLDKMMDEYYNLDYEDIVGGEAMRFNYKQVDPESFNLSASDILGMEDKELNQLVSLKYLAPYRANRDIKKQAWRVHKKLQAQEIAAPYENGNDDWASSDRRDQSTGEGPHSESKKNKRKRNLSADENKNEEKESEKPNSEDAVEAVENKKQRKKQDGELEQVTSSKTEGVVNSDGKRKRRKKSKSERVSDLSASRKEAYSMK